MILCPLLPKAYVEEAKKALKTNDEDVVNAAFIQWYQLHPDLTEYPSMEELSKYNTRVTNVKRNREYKQLAYRNSVKQKTQYIQILKLKNINKISFPFIQAKYFLIIFDNSTLIEFSSK